MHDCQSWADRLPALPWMPAAAKRRFPFGRACEKHSCGRSRRRVVWGLVFGWMVFGCGLFGAASPCLALTGERKMEKKILRIIAAEPFQSMYMDRRCNDDEKYRIYLIDNFEQSIEIVPEVITSHGEMLTRILRSGRNDIDIEIVNSTLEKGLAQVLYDLMNGGCVDMVISSIPGSNYTYDQIGSLLSEPVRIDSENILAYRKTLLKLLRSIAFKGLPSVKWLEQMDVNPIKLRDDAKKLVFIEALSHYSVSVILPYGNLDNPHRGKIKAVNVLSLAPNAKVFSALNQAGQRVPGFPYSPLSAGDEPAIYNVVECPHPTDPFTALLDINGDGFYDYAFARTGEIAYRDQQQGILLAPSALSASEFERWLQGHRNKTACRMEEALVLTAHQYRRFKNACPNRSNLPSPLHEGDPTFFVWINTPRPGHDFHFKAHCRQRGTIQGTSVIPPNKVKQLLPPKKVSADRPLHSQFR